MIIQRIHKRLNDFLEGGIDEKENMERMRLVLLCGLFIVTGLGLLIAMPFVL